MGATDCLNTCCRASVCAVVLLQLSGFFASPVGGFPTFVAEIPNGESCVTSFIMIPHKSSALGLFRRENEYAHVYTYAPYALFALNPVACGPDVSRCNRSISVGRVALVRCRLYGFSDVPRSRPDSHVPHLFVHDRSFRERA
jgi:hypothetical protein